MIPHLLKLLFEKADFFPSEDIILLVEKESTFAIPKFLDILVDLAYDPTNFNHLLHDEAKILIDKIVQSSISFHILRDLFVLQGSTKNKQIKTIKGNIMIKVLPDWKQQAFDSLIRRISSKKEGLRHLMLTLMDMLGNNRSPKIAYDIAVCFCRPPLDVNDRENHYKELSAQIIDLLKISNTSKITSITNEEKTEHSEYLTFSRCVAIECIHLCAKISKQYAQKYLLDIAFADFYRITDPEFEIDESEITILQSEQLMESLNLHYSLLTSFSPSHYVQSKMQEFSQIYLSIATLEAKSDNKFVTASTKIIIKLIELLHGSGADTFTYIKALVAMDIPNNHLLLNNKLLIRLCWHRDNIEVVNIAPRENETWVPSERLNLFLLSILKALHETLKIDIVNKLFLWLLEWHFQINEKNEITYKMTNVTELEVSKGSLLTLLSTDMESHSFARTCDILKLVKVVILRHGNIEQSENNEINNTHLNSALGMIVSVLESGKIKEEDKAVIDELYPLLSSIRDGHPVEKTRDIATDISVTIATKGHVNFLKKTKIDEDDDANICDELKAAFVDISSTEVPFMACGVVSIHKLLKEKNESAINNRNKIYHVLSQLLFHEDSYLYLRVIAALSVIGDQYTEKMLPTIAQKIRACRGKHSLLQGVQDNSSLADWMKLSEVFMKIIKNLGVTAPKYLNVILSSLMAGLRDEEDLIRASSLSNMAEFCSQSDFMLSSVIYEVVNGVCDALVHDHSALVKSAASFCIRRLLLGTEDCPRPDVMERFPADILTTISRSLKTVMDRETDDVVLDHASVAYKALNDCVREFVTPVATSLFDFQVTIPRLQ